VNSKQCIASIFRCLEFNLQVVFSCAKVFQRNPIPRAGKPGIAASGLASRKHTVGNRIGSYGPLVITDRSTSRAVPNSTLAPFTSANCPTLSSGTSCSMSKNLVRQQQPHVSGLHPISQHSLPHNQLRNSAPLLCCVHCQGGRCDGTCVGLRVQAVGLNALTGPFGREYGALSELRDVYIADMDCKQRTCARSLTPAWGRRWNADCMLGGDRVALSADGGRKCNWPYRWIQ